MAKQMMSAFLWFGWTIPIEFTVTCIYRHFTTAHPIRICVVMRVSFQLERTRMLEGFVDHRRIWCSALSIMKWYNSIVLQRLEGRSIINNALVINPPIYREWESDLLIKSLANPSHVLLTHSHLLCVLINQNTENLSAIRPFQVPTNWNLCSVIDNTNVWVNLKCPKKSWV